MEMLTEKVFARNGCPLHYWVGGKAGAPWLIFLHGACVDHHSFDPILPSFVEDYQVLAWDARGHGSSQPIGEPFTVPLAVDDLMALMEEERILSPVLIGHSNGTYIAQELVFRHPEMVKALAVIDGTCITWPHSAFTRWIVKASVGAFDWWPYESLKQSSVKYASRLKASQNYELEAFNRLSRQDFITIMKGVSLCLHPEPGYRIRCPLLIMHGDDDRMGDIATISPLWARQDPNYVYRVIPNAGHLSTLDNPQFIINVLIEFLDTLLIHSSMEESHA